MSAFVEIREQIGRRLKDYNFEVYMEPRGILRIMQLVFAVINLYGLWTYSGSVDIEYGNNTATQETHIILPVEYPFNLHSVSAKVPSFRNKTSVIEVSLDCDVSFEAESLSSTCWLSAIYVLIIGFIYVKFREAYESNGNLALFDFLVSTALALAWLASFGFWAFGQSELKKITSPTYLKSNLHYCSQKFTDFINCIDITRTSVTGLTISMILSFLNLFLWAAGIWFLYKETPWYLESRQS